MPRTVTAQEYELACEAYQLKYGRAGDRMDILSWLAEWFLSKNRLSSAVECFAAIPTSDPKYGRMARYQQGRTLLGLHQAIKAEQQLREVIALEEESATIEPRFLIDARQRLRHILEVELRFEERHRLLRGVILRREEDPFEAVIGCFPSLLRWNGLDAVRWLEEFRAASDSSPVLEIAMGRYLTGQGKVAQARPILATVFSDHPANLTARSAYIACLLEAGEFDDAEKLIEESPPRTDDDPWLLLLQRGSHGMRKRNYREAAESFKQVLLQDETCIEAWQGLAQAARMLNDKSSQNQGLKMATWLARIQNHLGKTIQDSSNPNSFLDVAELCEEINLNRARAVMIRCARRLNPTMDRVRAATERFDRQQSGGDQSLKDDSP